MRMISWGYQKHPNDCRNTIVKELLEYTRKWRVTTNPKKCGVVVCNEDKVSPATFEWKWGEDELPIVDQYTYLGVEISKDSSWDAHKQT